jgi:hypothetical protein
MVGAVSFCAALTDAARGHRSLVGSHSRGRQKSMTTRIFTVETTSDAEISIVHCDEGHWYNFRFVEDKSGRRILSDTLQCRNGPSAKHAAQHFLDDAKQFAEMEARKCGKID